MRTKTTKIVLVLFEVSLFFLLLQHNVFPSELTSLTLLLSIIFGGLIILVDGKLYFNSFLMSYGVFVVLVALSVLLGRGTGDTDLRLLLIIMEWISSLCIYNYLMRTESEERFVHIFIVIAIISLISILFLVGDRAIVSRLGHNGSGAIVSYYIAGTPIYKSSNGTANFCAIAMLFLLFYAESMKKWFYYIPAAFLGIGMLFCGSRKGLLISIVYLIYVFFFIRKGVTLKKIVFFIVTPVAVYFLVMKVPFIYDSVGVRVQSMLMNLFSQSNALDGNSFLMRQQLRHIAYEWIANQPIIGYGLNTFQASTGYGAENNLLQIMIEFGLVGTLTYYSFLIPMFRTILKGWRKSEWARVFCVLIVMILLQDYGSVSYSWQHMTLWYSVFWAMENRELGRCRYLKLKI